MAASAFHMTPQDQLNELTRAVGRIEGKLDNIAGLTTRVSNLEKWRAYLTGAWAVVVVVLAWLVKHGG